MTLALLGSVLKLFDDSSSGGPIGMGRAEQAAVPHWAASTDSQTLAQPLLAAHWRGALRGPAS